ncbi:ABC transporter ATP-binding protein [Peribacillus asahii]|uniref:ABC transporter ATP-binding protein n=1 Tax=Peribacillus asahii TaxID=228899 RepID=A0A3Q9RLG5_9BACI|nr:ABC transporter ATP-binding protein [Peribacillus asahii]AZV41523.1 ABC transporter ATP-binding protein [Peribacillus asahii]USK85915.1 ABC transporter ATP-binding protein [Peribacillus asahii]
MIYCKDLVKTFQSSTAVKGINLDINQFGCFGFLGGNGAGKTTTLRMLAGLAKPTSGEIKVAGVDVVKEKDKIAHLLGYLPQHPAFFDHMTGKQWMYWVGELFGLSKEVIAERTESLLKDCGIWEARNRKIGEYSGGMKQRLGLAQALINQPKVLILDEPVSALDPVGRYEVLQMISKLKRDMTIFMSSHILEDVEKVADHITVIDKGNILITSSLAELKNRHSHPIITFELLETNHEFLHILNNQEWIETVRMNLNEYQVTVKELEMAKRQLPKLITNQNLTLINYRIETASLEDIYLRLVS